LANEKEGYNRTVRNTSEEGSLSLGPGESSESFTGKREGISLKLYGGNT